MNTVARKKFNIVFCDYNSDPAKLIEMGYIGGSAFNPKTAFSIRLLRLLRLFHHIWAHGAVRVQGFSRALDDYLDANNPLILTANSKQVSDNISSKAEMKLITLQFDVPASHVTGGLLSVRPMMPIERSLH